MAVDWTERSLGEFVRLQRGHDLPAEDRRPGPIPVMGSGGQNGYHDVAMAKGPGVVIGRSGVGSMGVVSYCTTDYWPHNTVLYVTDFLGSDERFTYYFLRQLNLRRFDSGSAQASLNRNYIYPIRVIVPEPREQRAIAHILGTLDDKIELNRRMSETLEAMARALFKSWFVNFDPVRAKAEGRDPGLSKPIARLFPSVLVDADIGEIPDGWECSRLGEWVSTLSGGTPPTTDVALWEGEIPWISPKVMNGIHADEAEAYVAESAIGRATRLAPRGATLVMVRGMGLHEKVRVSQAREAVTFNQDVKALVPRRIEPSLLLFALLAAQPALLERVQSSGHGTGTLPSDLLLGQWIAMPPRAAQAALSPVFDDINDRIGVARGESRTLAALRDTLLPKLISGELRVKEAEKIAARAL